MLRASLPLHPAIASVTLRRPMRAFGGRALSALIDPARVSPDTLEGMERRLGGALSSFKNCRTLQLDGVKIDDDQLAVDAFAEVERGHLQDDRCERRTQYLRLGELGP